MTTHPEIAKIKARNACIIHGCKGSSTHKIQRLPHPRKDPKRFIAWLHACNRADLLAGDLIRTYQLKRICHKHFSPSCFYNNYNKLRFDAIPDIHLPDLPAEDSSIKVDGVKFSEMKIDDLLGFIKENGLSSDTLAPKNDVRATGNEGSCPQMKIEDLVDILTRSPLIIPGTPVPIGAKSINKEVSPPKTSEAAVGKEPCPSDAVADTPEPVEDSNTTKEVTSSSKKIAKKLESILKKKQYAYNAEDPIDVNAFFESDFHPLDYVETVEKENYSSLNSDTFPSRKTQRQAMKSFKAHNMKVLGARRKMSNPSVVSSIVSKARLKNKGTLYILPVKKKIDSSHLTSSRLEEIVCENTSGMNKKRLLNVLHGTDAGRRRQQLGPKINMRSYISRENKSNRPVTPKKTKTGLKRTCMCDIHCKRHVVSAGICTKIDGTLLNGDSELFDPSKLDNVFSLSTILTNVRDKYQIEQLCQLVIESVFRLKNINISGTMGTLTIYLTHNAINKPGQADIPKEGSTQDVSNASPSEEAECSFTADTIRQDLMTNEEDNSVFFEIQNENHYPTPMQKPDVNTRQIPHFGDQSIVKHKNVKLNLTAFHDHSYLSLESKIIFEKPEYLVHLIKVDDFKPSRKKSCLISPSKKVNAVKQNANKQKVRKRLDILRGKIKKKTGYITLLRKRNKFLRDVILTEASHVKWKYPKGLNDKRVAKDNVEEINSTPVEDLYFDTETGNFKYKTMEKIQNDNDTNLVKSSSPRKRKKKQNPDSRAEGSSAKIFPPNKRKVKRHKSSDVQQFDISAILDRDLCNNSNYMRLQISSDQDQEEYIKYRNIYESLIQDDAQQVICEEVLQDCIIGLDC